MKNINKKELFIKLIPLFITLLCCIGLVSYAFYKIKLEGQKTHFVSSDLISFTYQEGPEKIAVTNVTPVSDENGKKGNYFEFNVSSNLVENMSIDYEISILTTSTTNSFDEADMKLYLTDKDDNSLVNPVTISSLNNSDKITNAKIIYKNNFIYNNSNEVQTHTYRLRVWLKNDADLSKYTTITDKDNETNINFPSYSYKFKVNVNTVENKKGTDVLIALTSNKDNSGLYTITHSADSTLQIGATESITEYRYRGANPKNYVNFNGETWRIIGVFKADDGNGNIENRIKLIRNESIEAQNWNTVQVASTSSYNNWTGATLQTELNGTYLNSLTSEAQSMIGSSKYYLGGYNATSQTSQDMYSYERKTQNTTSNEFYYGTNPNSWIGKIALMYVSDYGYASDTCENKTLYNSSSSSNDIRACNTTNWLYKGASEWLLPQSAYNSTATFTVNSGGVVAGDKVNGYELGVRPVVYLTSAVQIIDGDGTSSNPYILSTDGEVVLPTIDEYSIGLGAARKIKVTPGSYPIDSYCFLDNETDINNCVWTKNTSSCASEMGHSNNVFNIFVKDTKGNIASKTYEAYINMAEIC